MKSNQKSANLLTKSINLSDIMKTTNFEYESEVNLIDEEIASSDLMSLSHQEAESLMQTKENSMASQGFSSKVTPSFANRVQSKLSLLFNSQDEEDSEKLEGNNLRYMDISLGDIPEELDDN